MTEFFILMHRHFQLKNAIALRVFWKWSLCSSFDFRVNISNISIRIRNENFPQHICLLLRYPNQKKKKSWNETHQLKIKREQAVIVHVSSRFMSRFLLWNSCRKFEFCIIFYFFLAHRMHILSLNNQGNKWQKSWSLLCDLSVDFCPFSSVSLSLTPKINAVHAGKATAMGFMLHLNDENWRARARNTNERENHKHEPCSKHQCSTDYYTFIKSFFESFRPYNHLRTTFFRSHRKYVVRELSCGPQLSRFSKSTRQSHLDCITHEICCKWRRGRSKKKKQSLLKRSGKELKNHTERARREKETHSTKRDTKSNEKRTNERKKKKTLRKITTTVIQRRNEKYSMPKEFRTVADGRSGFILSVALHAFFLHSVVMLFSFSRF